MGFNRKLRRDSARKVMKDNHVPKQLISKKVKEYTKMDNAMTLENEKKSINYVSLMYLLKVHYFNNQEFIDLLELDENDSELIDDYKDIKHIFYSENTRYNELLNGMAKLEFYKNSFVLMISRNEAYFNLLKNFDLNLQLVCILWIVDKLLVENTLVFNKTLLFESKEMARGDAYNIVANINSLMEVDKDTEVTIKAFMDKFTNLDGTNYSKSQSINIAKKHNQDILDTISKLGLKAYEDKIIKFSSELYNRVLEISNTTRLFEDIYTLDIPNDNLFLISYYLSIANSLDTVSKNITKPKLLALLKANSKISDSELSVVNSLMNYKANDKSLFNNKEVFYTNDNFLIMIFIVGLMGLPIRDEIIDAALEDIFGVQNHLTFVDSARVAVVRKDDLAKTLMDKYIAISDNIVNMYTDVNNVNNILVRTYYYTYKVEIDFLKESTKLMTINDFENILKENKIYRRYKTLIEF